MRAKCWVLLNSTWHAHIYLRYGGTYKNAVKWANKVLETDDYEDTGTAGAAMFDRDGVVCLWFDEGFVTPDYVAHEAFHAVYKIMTSRGCCPLTPENEESWAYLSGWLVGEILKKVPNG